MSKYICNFVRLTSIFSILTILFSLTFDNSNYDEYKFALLLPIASFVFFEFIFTLNFKAAPAVLYSFVALVWLRFTLMPVLITFYTIKGIDYITLDTFTIRDGIFYMVYELLFISILVYLLNVYSVRRVKLTKVKPKMHGSVYLYLFIIFFVAAVFVIYPNSSNLVGFFYIKSNDIGTRAGDVVDSIDLLVRQLFILGMSLIFIISLNRRNFAVSLFLGMLLICFIVGERRSAQIYSAFSAFILLSAVYPDRIKAVALSVAIPATSVILVMSIYKFLNVFLYDSYLDALGDSSSASSLNLSQLFQMYFFGPQNLAKSFDFAYDSGLGFSNFSFDFLRSIFIVNQLVRGDGVLTSEYFNHYVYGNTSISTGQVLSSGGYGAVFVGVAFAPIFTFLNVFLAYLSEIIMRNATSLEVKYLFSIITIRFATNIFGPTPALINYATMVFGTLGLCYFISIYIRRVGSK